MIQATRVFVTGASELPEAHAEFARRLGHRLMTDTNFVLVTGGLASMGHGRRPALDKVVAEAELAALAGSGEDAHSRIVTMLPESDLPPIERFAIGSVVRVAYAGLRTRRYSMVLTSDAVVAVHGGDATAEVIDLAYISGTPLIPVPATGGNARNRWNLYKTDLLLRLNLSEEEGKTLEGPTTTEQGVSTCLSILRRVLRARCFVAMPFDRHQLPNVFEAIREVGEEQGFQIVRVDKETFVGDIVDVIWSSIRNSDVVIADLTGHRPNVYYEMGISHALGKPTLLTIFSQDGTLPIDIPFDIMVQRILPYATVDSLKAQLHQHLPVATPISRRTPDDGGAPRG